MRQQPQLARTTVVPGQYRIYLLVLGLTGVAGWLLTTSQWSLSPTGELWNDVAVFAVTAILSEAWQLRGFANISSSVVFVPLFSSVLLFQRPLPMLIAGFALAVVETFVRRKPAIRVWFNTAQYMVAVGLGAVVYSSLGGTVSISDFSFRLIPFAGLIGTFFIINQGSVAAAIAITNGLTIRESWERIGGGARIYDVLASSLAILLAFLYVKLQFVGLAVVVLPLFLVRQLYQMNQTLQTELEEKLELMVKSIEARDPYTSGHSRRVAEYASAIAREAGLQAKDIDAIRRAALLHDVGKIYEEFAPLLRKETKLTPEERIVMQTHVVRSAELLSPVTRFKGAIIEAIKHHHENYDGTGYPDGLAGELIPIGARIIMIADTVDAMTTDRPYRRALTLEHAVRELRKNAGRQFDPGLVDLVSKSRAMSRLLGSVASDEALATASREVSSARRRWAPVQSTPGY